MACVQVGRHKTHPLLWPVASLGLDILVVPPRVGHDVPGRSSMNNHTCIWGNDAADPTIQRCLNRFSECPHGNTRAKKPEVVLAQESSATSKAAARRVSGSRSHALRVAAYQAFRAAGEAGLTDDELLLAMQVREPTLRDNSTRPRRVYLENDRSVCKAGRQRATRTGSFAEVYILTELAEGEPTW